MEILTLFSLAFILSVALFGLLFARLLKLPFPPVMLVAGLLISYAVRYSPVSYRPLGLAKLVAFLILPVVIFDVFSRIDIRKLDTLAWHALNTSTLSFIFSSIFVSITAYALIDGIRNIFVAIFLGVMIVASSDFDIPLRRHSKAAGIFMYEETVFSTALALVFAFTAVSLMLERTLLGGFLHIATGVGAGILIGLLIFKAIRIRWAEQFSHITLLISTVLCFAFAWALGGNPVLAVAAFGYLFGSVTIRDRVQFHEFNAGIVRALEAVLFLVAPFIVRLDPAMLLPGLIIYLMYLYARYFALFTATHHDFSLGEKFFLTLYSPKGTALLSMLMFLVVIGIDELSALYSIIMVIVFASMIVSSIVAHYGHSFDKRL